MKEKKKKRKVLLWCPFPPGLLRQQLLQSTALRSPLCSWRWKQTRALVILRLGSLRLLQPWDWRRASLAAWGGSCANAETEPNAITAFCVVTGGIGTAPKLLEMQLSRGFLFRSCDISSIPMQQISLLTGTNYVALAAKRNERNTRAIIQGGIQFLPFLLCKCEAELLSLWWRLYLLNIK